MLAGDKALTCGFVVGDGLPGARCVDCGGLETARILESLTALLIGINGRYKLHPGAGLRVTGLPT